jgi:hypothetical protein
MRGPRVLASLLGLVVAGCASAVSQHSALPNVAPNAQLLPTRIRRLTNLELERSVAAFTRLDVSIAAELPPEVRQEGYTPNAAQDVSAAWATRYTALVHELTARAPSQQLRQLLPCTDANAPACRMRIARELSERAWRRRTLEAEQRALAGVLEAGSSGGQDLTGGIRLLLRALLEAPSLLYVSELGGERKAGARVLLDDFELASLLSYTLRGGPPDSELFEAAAASKLRHPEERLAQAQRLLNMPDTRYQFRRFALEWLEVDGLLQTAKSSARFPSYDVLKPFMLAETESYVDEVMVNGGASVKSLIAGGFASVGPEMARFYGLKTYGPRASLAGTGRVGVLQQASFLAAHAHEDVTSPVKRGDFVMRKLLCEKVKRPAEIGLEVVMPAPSATLSNRQRLSQHISDPSCAGCHTTLDAIGYTFEVFDAVGARQTSDHGHAIDARAKVQLGRGRPRVAVDSSEALTQSLLENPTISECFARHAFRYFSAQSDAQVEAELLWLREQLPPERRDSLFEVLLAYIGSDLFAVRRVPGE